MRLISKRPSNSYRTTKTGCEDRNGPSTVALIPRMGSAMAGGRAEWAEDSGPHGGEAGERGEEYTQWGSSSLQELASYT